MHYFKSVCFVIATMILALLIGCSGGSGPLAPSANNSNTLDNTLPVISLSSMGDTCQGIGLMGAYELSIDPAFASAELVAKRVSSIGEDYIVSGISFFTIAPCATCLKIIGVSLDMTEATLTFAITHPFPAGDVLQPPSAANRLDLDVFDLAMVILPTGATSTTYSQTGSSVYSGFCIEPDGYTSELDNVVSDTAALPFFLVVDDSTDFDPPESTWNKFAMGAEKTFDVGFSLASGTLFFDMYLTMGYGFSAVKKDRLLAKYYNPEFNRKAAWKVDVTPPEGANPPMNGNTWLDNDTTTAFDVAVDVYDWQIGAVVSIEDDFSNADPSEIFAPSAPSSVTVEIPGMNGTLPQASSPDNPTSTGMPDDPWIYTIPIANENSLSAGEYFSLVKVTDERPVLAPADGRDFLIDTPDGIQLVNYEMPEYATYQVFTATVVSGCGPITGQVDSPVCPVTDQGNGATVDFTVSATSDNGGGNMVLYEVDFDYDGSNFTMDDSNTDGIFDNVGPFTVPDPCVDNIPYNYTVAFRGTDECTPPNVTVFATCVVTVNMCCNQAELYYQFDSCTTPTYECDGWSAKDWRSSTGGCGLPNEDYALSWDDVSWGDFKWGCNVGGPLCDDITFPYITSGPEPIGSTYGTCDWEDDHDEFADFNVVSPVINLPQSSDGQIEFDHCNYFADASATFTLYISEDGCNGPWVELWVSTDMEGCYNDSTVDISDYSGSNIMFRFQYSAVDYISNAMACGDNAGVVFDNIRIFGCFNGDLHD
jgi:hypothetical protein